ncbi:MAG: UbiA family prenyltransferase [Acidimicrobiales bacterium]
MPQAAPRRRGALVRAGNWWDHKVPPVVGVAALALASSGRRDASALVDLLLLLASISGIAAFGHVVNDWADIEADERGGKRNVLAPLAPAQRAALVGATAAVGLVPWIALPAVGSARAALAVEVALLLAYSLAPLRLKHRGWAGAVADAAYAYAVPFALVILLFGGGGRVAALAGAFGLLCGLRGILWHQVGDLEADRAAGVETIAGRLGPSRTEAVVASWLLPVELGLAAALVVALGEAWFTWTVVAFVAWRLFQVLLLWEPPLRLGAVAEARGRVEVLGFEFVNEFVERWLPVAALLVLAPGSWWWWPAIAVYLVTFRNAVRTFLGHDLWVVPDAVERILFSRGVRADIRAQVARRLERGAAGPSPVADPTARRFVFVVCGPISHLLTLRTAVHHLRPLTGVELWVLTDGSRNEQVIDIEGVDHVVDVATPPELDDHQASIWLKTSVHRHLPPGEWCYLDSDIIATVPGVEGVFDERRGPVAFASDVTVRENSVDRFSPWAMTCDCLGYGDQHSCPHLREQLQARFDLEVPGDWLHWNGGVFAFGEDSAPFLDLWHERAVASFAWPEWKTRDQGALIATVWTLGLQDLPRISPEFNFIADLGNHDLCLDLRKGWAHHPSGPWFDAKLLHLYTSPLEDPSWDLGADVEAVVIRRSRVRVYRYERSVLASEAKRRAHGAASDVRFGLQFQLERAAAKGRHLRRRLTPARLSRAVRARLGMDVSHLPVPGLAEPEPQRSTSRGGA